MLGLFEGDDNFGNDDDNSPHAPTPDPRRGGDELPQPLEIIPGSIRPSPSFPRTELASLLEDAPETVLLGQCFELTCSLEDKSQRFVELVGVNETVAYQRRHDGEILVAYAGFSNKTRARQWGEWLAIHHSVASGFEVRPAERLTGHKHELKVWGLSLKQIEKLALCDFSKEPRSGCFSIPKSTPIPVPSVAEITGIRVGDLVRSTTVRHWQFKVVAVHSDDFYVCERLGTNPVITQTLHLSSIELVSSKAAVEVVTTGAADDQFGDIKPCLGDVEEQARQALDSIQPPLTVFHAPIGQKQARANWKAFEATRHTLDLKNGGTAMKSFEDWREMEREQRALTGVNDESVEF